MDDHVVVDPDSNKSDPPIFGWCGLAALTGIVLLAVHKFFDVEWAGAPAAILLIGAGVVAIASGWYLGSPPPETRADTNQRIARGLVGTSIATADGIVTVVDDSTSGGDRRRRSVKAVDDSGRVGLMFVELDSRGIVVAAALPGGQWAPAQVVR